MRFLQTEWHRHERDRNAWDIERAEMKIKIADLEGKNRAAKKNEEAFTQRLKMLEAALRRERAKTQPATTDKPSEAATDAKPAEPSEYEDG
jgi:striatin 1/3/4